MITRIISRIRGELHNTFIEVNRWFDLNESLLNYVPSNDGWSIRKILEHISLTNHFLLILIKKATTKSIEMSKSNDYLSVVENYDLDWKALDVIGQHKSFHWNRPQHMEPNGLMPLNKVKDELAIQVNECNDCLTKLENGEGVLYKTMMSVNDLGKIDAYHYIYFLVQHARRHITQMEKVQEEFETTTKVL